MGRPKGSSNKTPRIPPNYAGQSFNKWTILEWHGTSKNGHPYYLCQCVCGRKRSVRMDALRRGDSKSCGCGQFERFSHLYKDNQQHCPTCDNWFPLSAFSKCNQGKVGEACRECRRHRDFRAAQSRTKNEKKQIYLKNTYGLSYSQFMAMATRQHYRCLGCQETFEPDKLCVDHNHTTGTIRGLLCSSCNTALGMIKDNEEILYRLSAYLSRDPEKIFVYLVGSLRNPHVSVVANTLRENGRVDVFDDYMAAGPEADDFWKLYENQRGRTMSESLKGRAAGHVFLYDRAHLDIADIILVVLPVGKSCMMEAGYSKAKGKPVYFLLDEGAQQERYDVMKKFADGCVSSIAEFQQILANIHI